MPTGESSLEDSSFINTDIVHLPNIITSSGQVNIQVNNYTYQVLCNYIEIGK